MTNLTAGEAAFVDPRSVPVLNHLDFLCRVVLRGEATAGSFSVIEQRARLGSMTPRHVHAREAETFIVLDGALEGWCEGQVSRVEAGQLIHLPVNREHAYRVVSDRAHYYLLITPAGFETFFLETGTVLDQPFEGELPVPGPVSPEKVDELVAVLTPMGASITGPPPFGPETQLAERYDCRLGPNRSSALWASRLLPVQGAAIALKPPPTEGQSAASADSDRP